MKFNLLDWFAFAYPQRQLLVSTSIVLRKWRRLKSWRLTIVSSVRNRLHESIVLDSRETRARYWANYHIISKALASDLLSVRFIFAQFLLGFVCFPLVICQSLSAAWRCLENL
jgi:hypothetical protein